MATEIALKNYRPGDLPLLVALINEADAVDQLERATTLEKMEHEMNWPNYHAETDCFLAWEGDCLVGYADFFLQKGEPGKENTVYTWGIVRPQWRRRGLGRRLLETLYRRATERLSEVEQGPVYFHGEARDVEEDRKALLEGFGMKPIRYYVNMLRPINSDLPPVEVPAGFRLRTCDPERDMEAVWRVDNLAFQDHWGFTGWPWEEYLHWARKPYFRPELWFLAEHESTGQVAGISLNKVDPDWIAQTGRQEGSVSVLAVLREHRHQGLGTALLLQGLHALRQAGMESAQLGADAENLTGAVRLYERVGFGVRKTYIAYRKVMRDK